MKTKIRVSPNPLAGFQGALPKGLADAVERVRPESIANAINRPAVVMAPPKRGYRWHAGFVAWVLHRLTGLGLAAYILLHVYVLSRLAEGPEAFNAVMASFDNVLVKLLEICLLGVVFYHTINGLRIVLMDYGPLANKETYVKAVAGTFLVIGIVVGIGGLLMFLHILGF